MICPQGTNVEKTSGFLVDSDHAKCADIGKRIHYTLPPPSDDTAISNLVKDFSLKPETATKFMQRYNGDIIKATFFLRALRRLREEEPDCNLDAEVSGAART